MSDFDAIDSLLASVTPQATLPPHAARRELREQARLSKTQIAQALGVSPSTIAAWENSRDPAGEVRTRYAYLLQGLAAKAAEESPGAAPWTQETAPTAAQQTAPVPAPETTSEPAGAAATSGPAGDEDDVEALALPEPCVLCGQPARQRVAGFPQHLDSAHCQNPAPPTAPAASALAAPAAATPAAEPQPPSTPRHSAAPSGAQHPGPAGRTKTPTRRAFQPSDNPVGLITRAVQSTLAQHHGDVEAATAALVKKAVPDAMALLDETRKGARYDVIAHPWIPDVLKKQTSRGPDQIWEARPKWTRPQLPPGHHQVTALDINGAYLSALKTHLPIGQLEHSTNTGHDRRRAGIHLITPPAWEHDAYLPNPIGERDEPGPLWVTEPTLRLLLRLSGSKYGLCEAPEVHESYTSGATENLLEKFRIALKDARDTAIADGDAVTLEYVKAMYSKFVSTMGESNYNRELYRPDWMHIIRSQAFANLWMKALKAHDEGLAVVRAMGTDELHVIGDWRRVFPEGRGVTEVKVKDLYTAGTDTMGEKR
ncbi:helix-turn-helix domain-containing protein [Streptomyces sp. NBC_01283]|uniref:helix-turn-helix domain-containing protein n=1 Tax=Streptomyces sp. NBC_01283 TaxID=2903812 RepID=UPI00352E04C8|nr:helix-turn-helix domain-containing protein [Streptomyces sp. NBC_01283]WSL21386.1 helix-turn-helix domain-containing protein [Streptomyces sp. NBC_01283]